MSRLTRSKPSVAARLTETTEHARTLLQVVGIRTGIPVDEFPFQCAIDQDGELAGGRGNRLGFANAPG